MIERFFRWFNHSQRVTWGMLLAVLVIGALILALFGCTDAYDAPPARPGTVTWRMVEPQQVAAACHTALPVTGCAIGNTIITRVPWAGDPDIAGVLQHEVAHTQGWRHPAWPEETPR